MNPLLLTVVLASNTVDSVELTLEAARKALDDAIQAAVSSGVTVEEIESEAGVEVTRE